jgi:MFS family permease
MSAIAASAAGGARAKRDRRNGFIGSYLGWLFDGYETYATVLIAAVAVNDLVARGAARATPLYVGGILATTLVAWACGGLLSGVLADYIGRRKVMLYSILWYAVFAGLTALAPSYALLLVFRFLTGLGMGAEWAAGSSLVSELWDRKHRGRGLALLQSAFGIGFLIATGLWQIVNNGDPGAWRWMYVVGVAPALLTLFIRHEVRDPELWTEADGRRRRAQERVAAGGGDAVDRELTKFTVRQVLVNPRYRKTIGLLMLAALSTTLGWWAVSTWIPQYAAQQLVGKVGSIPDSVTIVAVCYNAAGVIGYVAMGFLADAIGRKRTMIAYFAGSIVMVPVLFSVPDSSASLYVLVAINGFFTLGQWTWLALYPTELFPTHVRATAITLVFNIVRFAAAAGALLASALIDLFGSISTAAIVFGAIYGLGLVVTPFIGPETRAQPLPGVDDVARGADGVPAAATAAVAS